MKGEFMKSLIIFLLVINFSKSFADVQIFVPDTSSFEWRLEAYKDGTFKFIQKLTYQGSDPTQYSYSGLINSDVLYHKVFYDFIGYYLEGKKNSSFSLKLDGNIVKDIKVTSSSNDWNEIVSMTREIQSCFQGIKVGVNSYMVITKQDRNSIFECGKERPNFLNLK
jgi:hypothetical protein